MSRAEICRYIARRVKLRRKLTDKAIARELGLTVCQVRYLSGRK